MRIDDLDVTRNLPGAADGILATLEAFGLHWDGPVLYQQPRTGRYADALATLRGRGLTYPCGCSRRDLAAHGRPGADGPIYPGTCRQGLAGRPPRSERVNVGTALIVIDDLIHGRIEQDLAQEVGDFVLRRADGLHAYQLAVVVDDAEQGIGRVVRGADLLLSTPRQAFLQHLLGVPRPVYAHLPLALGPDGHKLSKSLAAAPVDPRDPLPALLRAWRFLGQTPLAEPPGDVATFWQEALARWSLVRVPRAPALPVATD